MQLIMFWNISRITFVCQHYPWTKHSPTISPVGRIFGGHDLNRSGQWFGEFKQFSILWLYRGFEHPLLDLMVPRLATSGFCAIHVGICDWDRVLAGTTSFHSVDFPWHRGRSVFPARGPGTLCRATFAMPHHEQRLRIDSKRIFSNLLIHELVTILLFFCKRRWASERGA